MCRTSCCSGAPFVRNLCRSHYSSAVRFTPLTKNTVKQTMQDWTGSPCISHTHLKIGSEVFLNVKMPLTDDNLKSSRSASIRKVYLLLITAPSTSVNTIANRQMLENVRKTIQKRQNRYCMSRCNGLRRQ